MARVVDNLAAKDYGKLLRTAGWKPSDGRDRKAAEMMCRELGADAASAAEFGRYNAIRRWSGVNPTSCVADLARAWIARWSAENPAAAAYEAAMRRRADRVMS